MARTLSLEYPGAIYHVVNRGDGREPILNVLAADLFNKTGRRRGSRFDCFIAATAILANPE